MAERRMISKKIIHSDAFLDMPISTQNLYFHLLLEADDDGFVNAPKRIQRLIGAGDDDAKILIAKKFIITFDSGVIVIKHWKIHNYIQRDRYKPTAYREELGKLVLKENKSYSLKTDVSKMDTDCIQNVRVGKVRLGKVSKGKISIGEGSMRGEDFSFSLKNLTAYENLSKEYKTKLKAKCLLADGDVERYEEFILQLQAKGYKYKNFYLAYLQWDKKRAYKDYEPTQEPNLGKDWFRVQNGSKIYAINAKTLEIKEGTLKHLDTQDDEDVQVVRRDMSIIGEMASEKRI